jgi:hypothetical protein
MPALLALLVVASCRSSFHPLVAAEVCHCSPSQYCHVRACSSEATQALVECLPIPDRCASSPTCGCLGRPIDACREELGAFTVLEPREVGGCDECSPEEYCWMPAGPASPRCGVVPARCEETPTCDCFLQARHGLGPLECAERQGRIVAGPAQARPARAQ